MDKKTIHLLSLFLMLGLLVCTATAQENQITNGEFDDDLTDWYRYGTTGFDVTVVQDGGLSGDNAVMLDIYDAAATASIGLARAPMQCEQDHTYPFSFMARAEEERQMAVLIQLYKPEGPSWIDVFFERVDLKTTPQLFTFEYEHTDESTADHPDWEIAIYYMFKGAWWSMDGSDMNLKVWMDQFVFGTEPMVPVYEQARKPSPADGATDVSRDVVLSWAAGDFAVAHDVYFGTDYDDVNNATRLAPGDLLVSENQEALDYDPEGMLDFVQTYYWRIDEVNAAPDSTIFKGNVWSFTTEPYSYPIETVTATSNTASEPDQGPENTVDSSGLDPNDLHSTNTADMWLGDATGVDDPYIQFEFDRLYKLHEMNIWNYNFEFEMFLGIGVKNVTVIYSADGTDWTTLGDYDVTQGPGMASYIYDTTIPFDGVSARFVRLMLNDNWGTSTTYGLSEVRFMYVPTYAREPEPADGDEDVDVNPVLSWRAGRDAASHQVYLSDDEQAVIDGTAPGGTVSQKSYDAGALDLDTVYYWRVDEINEAEAVTTWPGDVWSFSTQTYLVVEDFESYDDYPDAGTTIWQTWIDGLEQGGDPANGGAVVGYDQSPFAETNTVHGGWQAMPLFFTNTGGDTFSQTTRTFATAQDWTVHGVGTLSIYVHGDPANVTGQLYAMINGVKVLYVPATAEDDPITADLWTQWSIDLAEVNTDLASVTTLTIGIDNVGADGVVYIDDIQLMP